VDTCVLKAREIDPASEGQFEPHGSQQPVLQCSIISVLFCRYLLCKYVQFHSESNSKPFVVIIISISAQVALADPETPETSSPTSSFDIRVVPEDVVYPDPQREGQIKYLSPGLALPGAGAGGAQTH
jgi:hypothetical protein